MMKKIVAGISIDWRELYLSANRVDLSSLYDQDPYTNWDQVCVDKFESFDREYYAELLAILAGDELDPAVKHDLSVQWFEYHFERKSYDRALRFLPYMASVNEIVSLDVKEPLTQSIFVNRFVLAMMDADFFSHPEFKANIEFVLDVTKDRNLKLSVLFRYIQKMISSDSIGYALDSSLVNLALTVPEQLPEGDYISQEEYRAAAPLVSLIVKLYSLRHFEAARAVLARLHDPDTRELIQLRIHGFSC